MAVLSRAALWALGALLLIGVGCDRAAPLSWLGIASIRELPVERALEWAGDGSGRLVQLRDPRERMGRVPTALMLGLAETIPPELGREPGWLLVVASRPGEALRLAARLSRSGLPRVAVVTGDLRPLRELRATARRHAPRQERDTLQPSGSGRHPSSPSGPAPGPIRTGNAAN